MTAVALKIAYGRQKSRASLALFVIASTIATAYQLYWDLVIDWGLLVRKSANPWLRDQLILDHKWIYFLSMVLNAILRLAWLQSLTQFQIGPPQMDTYITDFVFACLEIIRRGHWNFYRLSDFLILSCIFPWCSTYFSFLLSVTQKVVYQLCSTLVLVTDWRMSI
jgi:hypothetical protein